MTRGRFDTRTWQEIVGNLVSERTSQGDTINLDIKYNGTARPTITLQFSSYDPDKSGYATEEDITDFLPDTPYFYITDDATGEAVQGEELQKGHPDWYTFINAATGLGPEIQRICKTGGRIFTYQERT